MSLDPGKLNKKIVIQRRGSGQDALGGESGTWATHSTVWANRHDVTNRETWEYANAGKEEAQQLTRWTVVNSSETNDVTSRDRISYGGKFFEILTVREVGEDTIEFLTRVFTN